jgi:uncharacterized alpha-E superfamily protein
MLSRVADSLFWLGRYAERAENYARFIDVNYNLALDLPPGVTEQWRPVISATGDEPYFNSLYKEASRENAIRFLAFDKQNLNSIINSVYMARENARQIRENITNEIWEVLNELYHYVNDLERKKTWRKNKPEVFREIKRLTQLMWGIGYDSVPRTQGWYFSRMGQLLERADKTSRILDVKYHILLPSVESVGQPIDFLHWNALLKSVSGFNSYRKLYGKLEPTNIVEYLILNEYFPRSILYCLRKTEESLHAISQSNRGFTNLAEKELGKLRSELEYADVKDIFSSGLHEYLDQLQQRINKISEAIYEQYFKISPNFVTPLQQQ